MKKIGIVTYYNIYNYGSLLQAYALQTVVESLGYQALIVDYASIDKFHNLIMRTLTYKNRIICCIKSPTIFIETLAKKKVSNRTISSRSDILKEKFNSFIADKLKLSTENFMQAKRNGFSAFITGSDQVWQLNAAGLHEMFFLRFAPAEMRIAYAPSFGGFTVPECNKKRLEKYLSEIPYLSIREDTGVDVVLKSVGRIVPQVLDPVLLAGRKLWEEEIKDISVNNNLLVCYFTSDVSGALKTIDALCEKYDLNVLWLTSGYPLKNRPYFQYDAAPLEFAAIIKNAQFVCTDSLHGTEISILFNVPFYTFDRKYEVVPEQSTRIDSLLKLACLKERLVKSDWDVDLSEAMNIDFEKTEININKLRGISLLYLKESLTNATKD